MSEKFFDVTKAKELYMSGLFDYQISEQLGMSRSTVQRWRTRTHLMANGCSITPRIKKHYNYSPDYPLELQQMMNETQICLNCGKKLRFTEHRNNRGYCSSRCFLAKPPKMAYAERVYGKPAREVILEMLNNGATMVATANRLGVNKQALYAWMDKLKIKKKVVWG